MGIKLQGLKGLKGTAGQEKKKAAKKKAAAAIDLDSDPLADAKRFAQATDKHQ